MESRRTPKFIESDCRGQNPSNWKASHIVGKFLERRCLKWVCMTHLDIWNTSYGQKKGWESNLAIWFLTIKSRELSRFPYVQVACDKPLESSWQRLQLCFRRHLNQRSTVKVIGSQSARIPTLGVLGQNAIWMLITWPSIKYTIRGKVVGSPKPGPWWVLWV